MRTWRSLARLLEGSRRLVLLSVGVAVLQSLSLVPIGLLMRHIFNTVIPHRDKGQLVLLGGVFLALYLIAAGLALFSKHVVLTATKRAIGRLRNELLTAIQTLPRTWLDRADLGTVHATVVEDSERVDVMAQAVLAFVLPSLVVAAALLGSLVFIDLRLVIVLLAVIPVLLVLSRVLRERVQRLVRRFQASSDRFSSRVLRNLRSVTTIRAHVAEDTELRAGAAEIEQLSADGRHVTWLAQAQTTLQGATSAVAGMLVLVLGGLAVIAHDLSIGDLLSFFTVLALVRGQATMAVMFMPQVFLGREALARLERLLALDEAQPYTGTRTIAFRGALAARHVTFGYGAMPVLRDVTLAIEPGERVALKGPNGMGKSTLVSLVLGLYRPDGGVLLVDGVPYDELDIRALRREIGVLLQDPVLFRGSVRDNVAYGTSASDDEIAEAVALATADDVVEQLPDGYRTEVGDDGGQLSAGQRQRIALARALIGRPPLLILDEPTSHLDEPTTVRLMENLAALSWDPTILLITHDPLVAAGTSRILEMRDGSIVAETAPLTLASPA